MKQTSGLAEGNLLTNSPSCAVVSWSLHFKLVNVIFFELVQFRQSTQRESLTEFDCAVAHTNMLQKLKSHPIKLKAYPVTIKLGGSQEV